MEAGRGLAPPAFTLTLCNETSVAPAPRTIVRFSAPFPQALLNTLARTPGTADIPINRPANHKALSEPNQLLARLILWWRTTL